ncbi:hypothetical protein QR680_017733 [Steinernema hermaphroditum]|uniref:Protein kinase domain-containing protein n=1 Tax=Steinernema hermaphroditum TaxID=289476 RepID=A0AA39LPJ7_9BILA|nr:hypothetical protein QR680_017733 [Steinernema hermaphroditum]
MAQQDDGPVQLNLGKLIGKRWKICSKLGEGGCGAVYKVEDIKTRAKAALKAESNFVSGGSVLKLEAQILRRLSGRKHVAQLLHAGKKERYCYMVMTLFGKSLDDIFRQCNKEFTYSTQVRIGIHILYGLKQLHEVGYVHRDIKPANLALGSSGKEAKIVHLLDFGLSREYIIVIDGKVQMRKERTNTLFRGTVKYCSANSHTRAEQGRPDDLWSMLYVLAEMRSPLPWSHLREKREVGKLKQSTSDAKVLAKCPVQMLEIVKHVRELGYYNRPDYLKIYRILNNIMATYNYKFLDPYDWDLINKPASCKSNLRSKVKTVEDCSQDNTLEIGDKKIPTKDSKDVDRKVEDEGNADEGAIYKAADFAKNELGF